MISAETLPETDMRFLEKYQPQLLGILRIVSGLLFLEHGTMKLLHWPVSTMPAPPAQFMLILTVAGIIETVGGALVTIGYFTRIAAFIMSGEMAIGFWLGHVGHTGYFFPAQNGGDAAVLFCFVFLYIAAAGPGPWSLDRK